MILLIRSKKKKFDKSPELSKYPVEKPRLILGIKTKNVENSQQIYVWYKIKKERKKLTCGFPGSADGLNNLFLLV